MSTEPAVDVEVDEDRVVRLENQVDALQAELKQTLDTLDAAVGRTHLLVQAAGDPAVASRLIGR